MKFNALIPELGRTQKLRINVSTYISATYFIGTALADFEGGILRVAKNLG